MPYKIIGRRGYQLRRNFETKSPDFQEVGGGIPILSDYKKQIYAIDAKLPFSLLFKVYAGMWPSDSPFMPNEFGRIRVKSRLKLLMSAPKVR